MVPRQFSIWAWVSSLAGGRGGHWWGGAVVFLFFFKIIFKFLYFTDGRRLDTDGFNRDINRDIYSSMFIGREMDQAIKRSHT